MTFCISKYSFLFMINCYHSSCSSCREKSTKQDSPFSMFCHWNAVLWYWKPNLDTSKQISHHYTHQNSRYDQCIFTQNEISIYAFTIDKYFKWSAFRKEVLRGQHACRPAMCRASSISCYFHTSIFKLFRKLELVRLFSILLTDLANNFFIQDPN